MPLTFPSTLLLSLALPVKPLGGVAHRHMSAHSVSQATAQPHLSLASPGGSSKERFQHFLPGFSMAFLRIDGSAPL